MIYRVTNGVPRGLYSRVAVTPLASSPWPAHAIYLSRLRDSSPLSFLSQPLTSLFSPVSVQRSAAASAQLHHSYSEALPRSAFEVDVSSGHIFVTSPRTARLESSSEAVQVNLREYPRLLELTFLFQFKPRSRIIPPRPRLSPILCRHVLVELSIRRVDNMFRIFSPWC